jgi:hypothetical protein
MSARGQPLASSDNWKEAHQAQIDNLWDGHQPEVEAAGLAPADNRESALFRSLSPGAYTAIVAGENGTTGVGLIEAYNVQ